MTRFQPATPASNAIIRPNSAKCGNRMLLAGMVSDMPGHDRCTFECPVCEHVEMMIVTSK
jgi:hypothetical protein